MSMPSNSAPPIPADQEALYGEWIRNQRWRDRLSRRVTHKSLNVPDDDMEIHATHGLTWRELLALAAIAAAAVTGWSFFRPAAPPPAAVVDDTDTNTQYEFDVTAAPR